jgi:signal transduction histidine kinase/ligand-binding sensor domain-containing protein
MKSADYSMRTYLEKMRSYLLLMFITLAGVSFTSEAQQTPIKFHTLNNSNGLSQNSVYSTVQDRDGFIWTATEFGLNRWDGYSFKVFLHDPNDKNSLSNNFINCLFTDKNGTVWVGTNGSGISKFNSASQSFTNYDDKSDATHYFENNSIWSIAEDAKGNLWIGTFGGGLKCFNPNIGKWKTYKANNASENPLSGNDIRSLSFEANGKLWVGTFENGVNLFDPETETFEHIELGDNYSAMCLLNGENVLWIGTHQNGILRLDKSTLVVSQFKQDATVEGTLSGNFIRSMIFSPQTPKGIWVGIWTKGLCYFDIESGECQSYTNDPANKYSIPDNLILDLFVDRSGLIWTGTYRSGLVRFRPDAQKFTSITEFSNGEKIPSNCSISGIHEGRIDTWLCSTSNGLQSFQRNGDEISVNELREIIGSVGTYCVLQETEDVIWIGTSSQGLIRYNFATREKTIFKTDPLNSGTISMNTIRTAYKDRSGKLWFGSYGKGLNLFHPETNSFTTYQTETNNPFSISDNTITVLFEDSKGTFWVGTGTGGLNRFDRSTGKFYRAKGTNAPGLSTSVTAIQEDIHQRLWIGTTTGLFRVIRKAGKQTYIRFTTKYGLPSDRISGLLTDSSGNLWISTVNGICKFKLPLAKWANPKIHNFDEFDGLHHLEFALGSYHKGSSGLFYFGGTGGATAFHPDAIKFNQTPPRLAFTSLSIMNEVVKINTSLAGKNVELIKNIYYLPKHISDLNEIQISYREQVISFEIALMDFDQPEKNQYSHKLVGFDAKWIYDKGKHNITYTNLPAGTYTLLVRGKNSNGAWSKEPVSLKIIVTPPFWETWWFRTLVLLFLVSAVAFYIQIRFKKLNREKIVLEQKVQERTEEINEKRAEIEQKAIALFEANEELVAMSEFKETLTSMLVHDLKNPLGSIVNVAKNDSKHESSQMIEHSANLMLTLIMNILDVQKLEDKTLTLDLKASPILEIGLDAISYVALSAQFKNITITIKIPENLSVHCDRSIIIRVLINLLSNAIQHTENNGLIVLEAIDDLDNSVMISVQDDGIGMSNETVANLFGKFHKVSRGNDKFSTGIGLQFCRLAVEAHDSKIHVESELGKGSKFEFRLPKANTIIKAKNTVKREVEAHKTNNDYSVLLPIAEKLKNLKVYEGSKILTELESINLGDIYITTWKKSIKNAIFSSNEIEYHRLIHEVLDYEH